MKKQMMSSILCICMILSMVPVLATVQTATPDACNVLFEENFESGVMAVDVYDNSEGVKDDSSIYTVPDGAAYGQGGSSLLLKNSNNNVQRMALGVTTGKLQNGNGGYTVEVNFDWNPFVSSSSNIVRVIGNSAANAAWNASNMSNTVSLYLIENGETQTLTVYDRGSSAVLNAENLVTKIGAHTTNPDHVYRTKVVITAAEATGTGATVSVYMDDVLITSFVNPSSTKDRYLCGFQFQHTGLVERGTIDNIKVLEYGTGVSGANSYINDDGLVAVIRRCESKMTDLSSGNQAILGSAIESAKAAHAANDKTQMSLDAAKIALEAVEETIVEDVVPDGPQAPENPENPEISTGGYQYRNLSAEDYEGTVTGGFVPYGGISDNNECDTVVVDDTADVNYGLDGKWYRLDTTVDEKYGVVHLFTNPSGNIRADATNIANHYKVELSFDYKMPADIVSRILVNANNNFGEFVKSGKIFMLEMNPETGIAKLTDRYDYQVTTFNLKDYVAGTNFVSEVNRFRFVFAPEENGTVERDGTRTSCGTMTLYINGVKACEEKYLDSTKENAIAGLTIKSGTDNAGKELGYIDNISFIDYDDLTCSVEGAIPYLNRDKLIAAIRGAGIAKAYAVQAGMELPEEFDSALSAAKNADFASDATNESLDIAANTLRAMSQIILKPIDGKVGVDSIIYSTSDLKTANSVDADVVVRSSLSADQTNQVLVLSVLYKNSANYPGGEMIQIASDTTSLGKMEVAKLETTLDLSGYTEAEKDSFYVKSYVLTGEDRMEELSADGAVLGMLNETTAVVDETYNKKAEIYKKVLADQVVFSLSSKTEKNDKILVYAIKKGSGVNDDLTDITDNNAKDKLVYFQISDANDQGESSVLFKPNTEGSYRVVAFSKAFGKIFDNECMYVEKAVLTQTLADLKGGVKTVADVKGELDLDSVLFEQCRNAGIGMNEITYDILNENSSPDAYEFKKLYSKYMDVLHTVKTANDLDAVAKVLTDYGYQGTNNAYVWNQICNYVFNNRASVTSVQALNSLLSYQPPVNNGGFGTPVGGTGGGFGGGAGGAGGGYATTAPVDQSKADAVTPYEENTSVFSDISGVPWAEEAIVFLAKNQIINGKSEGVFAPDDAITREEFAKIVVNMFGTGKESEIPVFTDVDMGSWYYPYIVKAYADGIIMGVSDDNFGVGMQISREDAIVMLYRAGNLTNVVYSDKAEFIPFEDECSDYAQAAVETLAKSGIVSGIGNNLLGAKRSLTRAEAAKMVYGLYRFVNHNAIN